MESAGDIASSPGNGHERRTPLARSLTQPQGTIEYLVSGNDTLASVAARFQTTPSELARINKISSRLVFPGQVRYFLSSFAALHDSFFLFSDHFCAEASPECEQRK